MFNLSIKPTLTCFEVKHIMMEKVNEGADKVELEKFRIRNPKVEDLGDVVPEGDSMECHYLYDGKEIYFQRIADNEPQFINQIITV